MRAKLIVGNWKMNGSLASNAALLAGLRSADQHSDAVQKAVCVPFPYLSQTATALSDSPWQWGAQDVSAHSKGAYTGEVSAAMLGDFSCRYVLVGHSERRSLHGESDAEVAAKFLAARQANLTPIVCVGETLAEREAGQTLAVVERQLQAVITALQTAALSWQNAVIAYEPVWAIGTGLSAKPQEAEEVHAALRRCLAASDAAAAEVTPILYGGSVKADNAKALFALPNIDGALVGGAALDAASFLAIVAAAV